MDTDYHDEDFDVGAQQAARDAVMAMQLFPELTVRIRGALGAGPHVDMLQHFCYWMHPRKPKMQRRWTLYKTFDEWREECGLSDRQVKKGRKVLSEKGLVTYKRGQYSRVYYRVDWVALAQALGLDYEDDIPFDFDEAFEDEFMSDGYSVRN